MTTTAAAPRTKFTHTDVTTLINAFNSGGLEAACAAFPHISAAGIEKKLRAIGALKPRDEDIKLVHDIVEKVKAAPHPWLVADHVRFQMATIEAAHERELTGATVG